MSGTFKMKKTTTKNNKKNPGGGLEERLKDALIKRAVGGNSEETVEEYAFDGPESGLKLVKRKISTKYNPPDVAAVKALLALEGQDITGMTDVELIEERDRLMEELKEFSVRE